MRVMKFGGTSVGSLEGLQRVEGLVLAERESGSLAVVVSAMGHSTDRLREAVALAAQGDAKGAVEKARGVVELARMHAPETATRAIDELGAPLEEHLNGMAIVREATLAMTDYVMSFGERLSATVL